jgi:hypothetical protein
MPHFNPATIAAAIKDNIRLWNTRSITWDEFSALQRATWDLVSQGEERTIGSECDKRHVAVSVAMSRIGL